MDRAAPLSRVIALATKHNPGDAKFRACRISD